MRCVNCSTTLAPRRKPRSTVRIVSTAATSSPSSRRSPCSTGDRRYPPVPTRSRRTSFMALDPNRWTIKTQEAFTQATEAARANSNPEVTPDHLLAALLRQEEGVVLPILNRVGTQPLSVRNAADEAVSKLPKAYGTDVRLSRETQQT